MEKNSNYIPMNKYGTELSQDEVEEIAFQCANVLASINNYYTPYFLPKLFREIVIALYHFPYIMSKELL